MFKRSTSHKVSCRLIVMKPVIFYYCTSSPLSPKKTPTPRFRGALSIPYMPVRPKPLQSVSAPALFHSQPRSPFRPPPVSPSFIRTNVGPRYILAIPQHGIHLLAVCSPPLELASPAGRGLGEVGRLPPSFMQSH